MNENGIMQEEDLGPVELFQDEVELGPDGTVTINGLEVSGLTHARPSFSVYVRRGTGRSINGDGTESQCYNDIAQIIIEVAGAAAYDAEMEAQVREQHEWPLGERHYVATHLRRADGASLSEEEIDQVIEP